MNIFENELNELKSQNNYRFIKNITKKDDKFIYVNGQKMLNLSSNNYLGIGNNIELQNDFLNNYNKNYSFGSNSSRLLTGNEDIYLELETLLADIFKKDKALIFNSGYQANVGIISGLLSKKDVIFCDKLNHASIIDGIQLSGAKMIRYNHLCYEMLEQWLQKERHNYEKAIIITESLFSMDGDIVNMQKIIELKYKYDCILLVDESHSFGVYGYALSGLCQEQNAINDIDLIISSFGKSISSVGAFCVGNTILIDYLINKARSFIFSTTIAPINIAWSNFIIKNVLNTYIEKSKNLLELSKNFINEIKKLGYTTTSESYIIPIIINDNGKLEELQNKFLQNNYYVLPIRYPTVPKNASRFRISLTANMKWDDIVNIIKILNY